MSRHYMIDDISVCTVCLHLLANGEYGDGTDSAELCAAGQVELWGDDVRNLTLGGEELGFSWQACEGCGQGCGGDRYRAHVMTPMVGTAGPTQADMRRAATAGDAEQRAISIAYHDAVTGKLIRGEE